jgi:hypothetical protein
VLGKVFCGWGGVREEGSFEGIRYTPEKTASCIRTETGGEGLVIRRRDLAGMKVRCVGERKKKKKAQLSCVVD